MQHTQIVICQPFNQNKLESTSIQLDLITISLSLSLSLSLWIDGIEWEETEQPVENGGKSHLSTHTCNIKITEYFMLFCLVCPKGERTVSASIGGRWNYVKQSGKKGEGISLRDGRRERWRERWSTRSISSERRQYANELVIPDGRRLESGKAAGEVAAVVLLHERRAVSGCDRGLRASGFRRATDVFAKRVEALDRKWRRWAVLGGCVARAVGTEAGSRLGIGFFRFRILFRIQGRQRRFRRAHLGGCAPQASD